MRNVTIDFSKDESRIVSAFGGYDGEHNETELTAVLPERMVDSDNEYRFIFETADGEEIVSSPVAMTDGKVKAALIQQVMKAPELKVSVAAYKRDGETLSVVAKTALAVLSIMYPSTGIATKENPYPENLPADYAIRKAEDGIRDFDDASDNDLPTEKAVAKALESTYEKAVKDASVKPNTTYGTFVTASGELRIYKASNADILGRKNEGRPIVPSNLEYAVKSIGDGYYAKEGEAGESGATFIPSVSSSGVISWTNDKDLPNPSPVNIKGPKGDKGDAGYTPQKDIDYFDGNNGRDGEDGESVTVDEVIESTEDGGTNLVIFSNGKNVSIKNGSKGSDGYTPIRGKDYWTEADKAEIKSYVDEAILGGWW